MIRDFPKEFRMKMGLNILKGIHPHIIQMIGGSWTTDNPNFASNLKFLIH